MIAAGVVLSIVVGYLAQPLVTRGARWLWRGARVVAEVGFEIVLTIVEWTFAIPGFIGDVFVTLGEGLGGQSLKAEVARELAEAQSQFASEMKTMNDLLTEQVFTTAEKLDKARREVREVQRAADAREEYLRMANEAIQEAGRIAGGSRVP